MKQILLCFILILPLGALSQINTEIYRKDYKRDGWMLGLDGLFSYSSGNTEELSAEGSLRVDYNGKKQDYFTVINYEFESANDKKINDNAFIHLRTIRDINKWLYWEIFLQTQFDEFILLNHRHLGGTGARIDLSSIMYPGKERMARKMDVYYGLGAMWETEDYELETRDTIFNLVRVTSYLTVNYKPTETLRMSLVNYFQPVINKWSNFRNRLIFELEFIITEKLSFISSVDFLHRSVPIGGTNPNDIKLKNGLRVRLP